MKRESSESPEARVRVAGVDGHRRLEATGPIAAGETVVRIHGVVVGRPTQTSVQIDDASHIDVPAGLDAQREAAEYPWRFMNHSCDPNVRIAGRRAVALRKIAAGEEISFDYNATELDMSTPFVCRCASPACKGALVRGFAHLGPAERRSLEPVLSEHLRRRLPRDRTAARAATAE